MIVYLSNFAAVAYTCTVYFLRLVMQISPHFCELEQIGHYLIVTSLSSTQERSFAIVTG